MAKIFILPPPAAQTATSPKLRRNQRADKRFCVRVTVTDPVTGKKRQQPFYGQTQGEAKTKAEAFKKELDGGMPIDEYTITVSQWIDKWMPVYMAGKAYSTRYTCEMHCNKLKDTIGNMRIRDVRVNDLQRALNIYIGKSTSSIHKMRVITKAVFASAVRNRLISYDPSASLVTPKGTYQGHRALEKWEIDLVTMHWRVRRAGLWMMLMLYSGIRRGEACAMEVSDYDTVKNELNVKSTTHGEKNRLVNSGKPKTPAGVRTVPIFDPLVSALRESLQNEPRKYILRTESQEPMQSQMAFKSAWDVFLSAISKIHNGYDPERPMPRGGTPEGWIPVSFTAHDLRYTYATMLYDAGVDEKTAQLWMGHTSPQMTRDLYAQLSKEREAKSTKALEAHLKQLEKDRSKT